MPVLTNWLNKLVKNALLATGVCLPACLYAQQPVISLQQAFHLAEQNYPLIRQKGLLHQTEQLTIANLTTGYFPQFSINGQATYQSDVTRVDIPIPNIKIPAQSKDQYKAIAEADQLLYDGGLIRSQKNIQQLNTAVAENQLAVSLYELKNRINQLYFSILYQDQLLQQSELALKDVQTGIDKIKPQVENGVLLRSNLQLLQAQLLQVKQREIEIKATRKGLADALSLYLNQPITEATQLLLPESINRTDTILSRPELKLFESQTQLLAGQEKLINAKNLPRAFAFVQGGYGKPGLNLLSNEFKPFYITGLRLNWSLGGLYTAKRERKLTDINRQTVDLQKDVFTLNTRTQLKQVKADIDKYTALVASDEDIIQLRHQVTEAAKAQLENNVITSNDYLLQVNAEDQVRQSLILHRLQLLQAQTNYAIISGNL